MQYKTLSEELITWQKSKGEKTIGGLIDAFEERGFAMLFLLLMFLPATPLPTGGITHVFEGIVILVALETLIGRSSVWLPGKLRQRSLGPLLGKKVLPFMIKRLQWLEKYTRPRWSGLLFNRPARAIYGLIVIVFTLAAAFAVPFSGLDTLPSLGVVVMSLALFFGDSLIFLAGIVIGSIGTAINTTAIIASFHWIAHFFK